MTIVAECHGCDDRHPVADRPASDETAAATVCPVCSETGYRSHSTDGDIEKSEAARISDAVSDVYGVGDATRKAIIDEFDLYAGLANADQDRLETIDSVGEKTAQQIVERT